MATLGGAPAKRAARSTHLERGENPITLPSQEDTIARRPDEEYVLRFGGYLDTSEYSDVSFCCQDNSPQQILRAHRIIIASHSDVLKEIMRDQKGEGEENDVIVLDRSVCLDPRSFAACLSWMYRREEPSVSTGALHLASVMGKKDEQERGESGYFLRCSLFFFFYIILNLYFVFLNFYFFIFFSSFQQR